MPSIDFHFTYTRFFSHTKEKNEKLNEKRYQDTTTNLVVSKLDVLSVQPLDTQTRDLLDESVKKTVVLTTEASLKAAQV